MSHTEAAFETRGNGSETDEITRDQTFTMLSNRRRRWVIHYLKRRDGGPVSLRTLVNTISAWEHGVEVEKLSWKQRKRVYTALRQSHLPKLDDAGVVEYDSNRGEIVLTEEAEKLQLYLEYVPERDIPWHQYYLGLATIATALTLVTWLSLPPVSELSGLALSSIITAMIVVSAITHVYHARNSRLGSAEEPPR
ncbi:DUF7344 domain-containing protein [Natrialba swarupiae]|uniref:DUF7344 domain-containing protein n=1 Tax=Natrialba swarupiae TaxID=2448032 RepID=A0A5D5ANN5_9EURY|nr:hypothetical protein [Natrialba swarupiae]TYT62505.1 hypothetical protein FYC77_08420 [Natrialba swarupiae]